MKVAERRCCARCNVELAYSGAGRPRKYCPACSVPIPVRRSACLDCGIELPSGKGPKKRCDPCMALAVRARKSELYFQSRSEAPSRACGHCGTSFTPDSVNVDGRRVTTRKYCSDECRRLAGNQRRQARKRALRGDPYERDCAYCGRLFYCDPNQRGAEPKYCRQTCRLEATRKRRRAKRAGAEHERVLKSVVFMRDKGRCGICRKKIDRFLPYPDPMSASLDHVVPISQGGAHTYANVRITHLSCNVVRSNRGGGEQLAMIG